MDICALCSGSLLRKHLVYCLHSGTARHCPKEQACAPRVCRFQGYIQREPGFQALNAVLKLCDIRQLFRMLPVQIIDGLCCLKEFTPFFLNTAFLLRPDQPFSLEGSEHGLVLRNILLKDIKCLIRGCRSFFESHPCSRGIHPLKVLILVYDMADFQYPKALQFFKDRFSVFL